MKSGWLLYDDCDLAVNRDFAAYLERIAPRYDLSLQTVTRSQLTLGAKADGALFVRRDGDERLPAFVVSRQRDAFVSRQLELLDVPVFNSSKVCELCNDKRKTHQFLHDLPMPRTFFGASRHPHTPDASDYPLIVKPCEGHGGERIGVATDSDTWRAALEAVEPSDYVAQSVVSNAGRDLRVYVLFGQIVAGVMRTAKQGVVSNYKRGGNVALHEPNARERALAEQVIERFEQAGAPLCFAGVDLLYEGDEPVLGEVEDVVGSRMLYRVGDIDVAALYLQGIARMLDRE